VQPQTWLSAQQLEQLAKISDLWLIIEPVHLLPPIKGLLQLRRKRPEISEQVPPASAHELGMWT